MLIGSITAHLTGQGDSPYAASKAAVAHLGRNLGAQVGYRRLTADFTVDNDAGNMKLKGPYFGGVLRF